ncbi:MAG: FkbM family methyltransferase [Planctomycetes bacterium]|nr:FkbM family methyltransferase [Planctomycetota bacterium]
MCSLWDVLGHKSGQIKIVDVGALVLDDEPPDYHALLKPGVAKVIAFEPDEQECQKINQSYPVDCLCLPYFIGDGSERTFNVCNCDMTSSLYEPNTELLEKFQALSELTQVVRRCTVSTKRLDDIDEVQGADYLKIDVQGAEVDVFNGAKNLLADIMIIHTEVEFVPMYIDQPLFAEVDQILRKNGFLFHKFYRSAMAGRTFKPLIIENNSYKPLSQALWSDVIYVKNFLHYDRTPPEKLLKLAVILHDVYGSYDLVHYILAQFDKQTSARCAEQYLQQLMGRNSSRKPLNTNN